MPARAPADAAWLRRFAEGEEEGRGAVVRGDNLDAATLLPDGCAEVVYLDPPFNTGKTMVRRATSVRRAVPPEASSPPLATPGAAAAAEDAAAPAPLAQPGGPRRRVGFHGHTYDETIERLSAYNDRFADYFGMLEPRLLEAWRLLAPNGTLYLHLDYREVHYAKVACDALFGRDRFLNEIIWAYDYGAKTKTRWPAKHDTILVYAKTPGGHIFNADDVDREPYMAPKLVTPEKRERGKLPTDVWWHTIVSPTGREKTGYATQKPVGILRRIIAASSHPRGLVVDLFAGSGTTGAAALELGRRFVLVDESAQAIEVMRARFEDAPGVVFAAVGRPRPRVA